MPTARRLAVGSSPLARGGQRHTAILSLRDGLIPAGAGRTSASGRTGSASRAHPRWRGADVGNFQATFSPEWLIPAGAGRTSVRVRTKSCPGAHPRWRGADADAHRPESFPKGSSPLARGGQPGRAPGEVGAGLIPAGAGRTSSAPRSKRPRRAHPRWRGADHRSPLPACGGVGSSPLARGGRATAACTLPNAGLIPAGAGRTWLPQRSPEPPWAHPRWRGADRERERRDRGRGGSSPLARGGRVRDVHGCACGGLIPAGAGRTRGRTCSAHRSRAHPRWRGADIAGKGHALGGMGSSPLARGGRSSRCASTAFLGLIPAGAGRTSRAARR